MCSRQCLCDLISIPGGIRFCYVHFTEEKVEVLKCSGYRAGQGQGQDSSRQSPSHHHRSLSQENRTTPFSQALAWPQLLSPGPGMWAPRDRSEWGGTARGQRGGARKGATGKVSDGTQRPRHCKGLVWASCPHLRTLVLSGGSPEWAWARDSEGGGASCMDLGSPSQRAGQAHKHTVHSPQTRGWPEAPP